MSSAKLRPHEKAAGTRALLAAAFLCLLCLPESAQSQPNPPEPKPAAAQGDKATTDSTKGGSRLASEESEYLRMHAENPVEWFPWGEAAFARARELDRPVFISIGYSSCHWCHVMRRESFEDEEIAKFLNEHFVSIKVDREELPHVDDVYMAAVQTMTGGGGWPLSVFASPDAKPFFGGTYFPPREKWGNPGFLQLLNEIQTGWKDKRKEITDFGDRLTTQLVDMGKFRGGTADAGTFVRNGVDLTLPRIDKDWGGFQGAPKFPSPRLLQFYAALAIFDDRDDLRSITVKTLERMAAGGIFDQIGGGFHRYSVDAQWRVPHFEKMLYSQGLMAETYLEAARLFDDPDLSKVARRTLDAMIRDFQLEGGAFASSWDADSEEEEGTFYVWTPKQVREVITDPDTAEHMLSYLGITDEGNFEGGRSVPHQAKPIYEIAREFTVPAAAIRKQIDAGLAQLLEARAKRVPPLKDEKVILGWNALAVSALARAGTLLGDSRYTQTALRAHAFADRHLALDDGFLRRWARDSAEFPATLQDASLHLKACLDLYEASFDPKHVSRAREIAKIIVRDYGPASGQTTKNDDAAEPSETGGAFYETRAGVDVLVPRRRVLVDQAIPAGNSVLARCLLRLHGLTGLAHYRETAMSIIGSATAEMKERPFNSPEMLLATLQITAPSPEIAVFGDLRHPLTQALLRPAQTSKLPFYVIAHRPLAEAGEAAAKVMGLLDGRTNKSNRPTAYLCENFVCQAPQSDPNLFRQQFQALIPRPQPKPAPEPTTKPTSQPKG